MIFKKRIFLRSKDIIEREVKKLSSTESVLVVEKIVETFRKGEKTG